MTAGVERLRYRWPSTTLVHLDSLTPDAYLRGSESPDVVVVDARTARHILRKTTAGVHLIFGTRRALATLSLPRTVSFASAGASGMVGTEERIYSDFADEVGRQLAAALQTSPRTPLGRVVRDARVALLREGSPLGFTLTAYGSADLIVEGDAE